MKHILIVPDKFKGSLTSLQAAQAIKAGFERQGGACGCSEAASSDEAAGDAAKMAAPHYSFQLVEIADGGDGSLDVVAGRVGSPKKVSVQVHDPLFREVSSQILLYGGGAGGGICGAGVGAFQGRAGFEANSCSNESDLAKRAGFEANSCPEFCGDAFRADFEADSRSNLRNSIEQADSSHDSRSELVGQEKGAEKVAFSRPESHLDSRQEQQYLSPQAQPQNNTPLCAFIEMAKISGLAMLDKSERNPLNTSTYGLGEAICAARGMGARKITLSIGGSATDDCGAGMLQAIGFEFFNRAGELIPAPICGKDLQDIGRIDLPDEPIGCRIEVICDVDNPLLGEHGATAVYAPQKGATPEAMEILEKGKANMAEVAERCLHIFPQMKLLPGAGAAGGVGYAGTAFLGGKLLSGWRFFTEITSLEEKVQWADVVVTGEGSVDSQSLSGKIVGGIMELARKWNRPVEIFCGISSLDQLPQGVRCHSLVSIEPDTQICMTHAAELLERLAEGVELF